VGTQGVRDEQQRWRFSTGGGFESPRCQSRVLQRVRSGQAGQGGRSDQQLEGNQPECRVDLFIDAKGTRRQRCGRGRFEMGAPNALLHAAGWSKSDIKVGTEVPISRIMARYGGVGQRRFPGQVPGRERPCLRVVC